MNGLLPTTSPLWLAAGWTMVHFIWVGGLLGVLAAAGRFALRRTHPDVRYAYSLCTLSILAITPVVIGSMIWLSMTSHEHSPDGPHATMLGNYGPRLTAGTSRPPLALSVPSPAVRLAPEQRPAGHWLGILAGALPLVWLLGTPLTFAWLASGIAGAERLRRSSRQVVGDDLNGLCDRLAAALRISRRIGVAICDRVAGPVLVGIVRPLILLPPAALSGWTIEQLEIALVHELAHVKRWDNLVNLLQRTIEAALFFQPAVWIVSGWVRREREHCCDRMVVAHTGRPRLYAGMLADLAMKGRKTSWAVATMAEAPVVVRIRQILNLEDCSVKLDRTSIGLAGAVLAVPGLCMLIGFTAWFLADAAASEAPSVPEIRQALSASNAVTAPKQRAELQLRLGQILVKSGEKALARDVLHQAAESLGHVGSFPELVALPHAEFAEAQAKAGDKEGALATLRKMEQIADTIKPSNSGLSNDVSERNFVLRQIISVEVRMGEREAARATFDRAYARTKDLLEPKDSPAQTRALGQLELVRLWASLGEFNKALRSFEEREERPGMLLPRHIWPVVRAIAEEVKEGDTAAQPVLERAAGLLGRPDDWPMTPRIVRELAEAQLRAGDRAGALRTASLIPEGKEGERGRDMRFHKVKALNAIAEAQIGAGERADARRTCLEAIRSAQLIEEKTRRFGPLSETALLQVVAGDVDGAVKTTLLLDPGLRSRPYTRIGQARFETGDRAAAHESFRLAMDDLESGQRNKPPDARGEAERQCERIEIQAMNNDVAGALRDAGAMAPDIAGAAYSVIAEAQARSGRSSEALGWINRLESPKSRELGLQGLVYGLWQRSGNIKTW